METAIERMPVAVFDLDDTVILDNVGARLLEQLAQQQLLGGSLNSIALRLLTRKEQLPPRQWERMVVRLLLLGLRGQCQKDIKTLARRYVVDDVYKKYSRFTMALLQQLRLTHFCLAITGSPEEMARPLTENLRFNGCFCTSFEVNRHGRYTGRQLDVPSQNKGDVLDQILKTDPTLTLEGSIGIGNSYTDIPMLSLVEQPLAFNPDQELSNWARQNNCPIVIEDGDTKRYR